MHGAGGRRPLAMGVVRTGPSPVSTEPDDSLAQFTPEPADQIDVLGQEETLVLPMRSRFPYRLGTSREVACGPTGDMDRLEAVSQSLLYFHNRLDLDGIITRKRLHPDCASGVDARLPKYLDHK